MLKAINAAAIVTTERDALCRSGRIDWPAQWHPKFCNMPPSILNCVLLGYFTLSGAIAVAGLSLIAKCYFFPKARQQRRIVNLIDLGFDGAGRRSEISRQSSRIHLDGGYGDDD